MVDRICAASEFAPKELSLSWFDSYMCLSFSFQQSKTAVGAWSTR